MLWCKQSKFGLRFWSCQVWKPPGLTALTAIPVPNSHIRAALTPSYHKKQRQVVGVHRRPGAVHCVVCGGAPLKSKVADFGALGA